MTKEELPGTLVLQHPRPSSSGAPSWVGVKPGESGPAWTTHICCIDLACCDYFIPSLKGLDTNNPG
jgi:hypothetical protein